MKKKHETEFNFKIKTPIPSRIFFYSYLVFNLLPSIYLLSTNYYEGLYDVPDTISYYNALSLNLVVVLLFGIFYTLFSYFLKFFFKFKNNNSTIKIFDKFNIFNGNVISLSGVDKYIISVKTYKLVVYFGLFGSVLVWLYFFTGGYEKLLLIGSDTDQWEFRIISYDDRSRLLIAFLEISRRFILPFTCVYLLVLNSLNLKYTKSLTIYFLLFTQFLSGVMTLDRGPILLFFIMFVFVKINFEVSRKAYVFFGLISFLGVIFLASFLTYIQYNILDFSFAQIVETAFNFIWHRTILVPSIASVELSYFNFPFNSEKLFFAFSRLGAIFGNDYIAIGDENSIYVTPVGFIADIWRNIGLIGVILFSFVFAILFNHLNYLQSKMSPLLRIPYSFTVLSFCFFLIFGVFFSQGIFVHIFLMYIVSFIFRNEKLKIINDK